MKPAIRVGIIGFGFMGQTHARAYLRAKEDGYPCELVAIADHSLKSLDDLFQMMNIDTEDKRIWERIGKTVAYRRSHQGMLSAKWL